MNHFVHATQLRVFIRQRVEAVCAGNNDLLGLDFVERFHVLHSQHLKKEFVTRASRGIA